MFLILMDIEWHIHHINCWHDGGAVAACSIHLDPDRLEDINCKIVLQFTNWTLTDSDRENYTILQFNTFSRIFFSIKIITRCHLGNNGHLSFVNFTIFLSSWYGFICAVWIMKSFLHVFLMELIMQFHCQDCLWLAPPSYIFLGRSFLFV